MKKIGKIILMVLIVIGAISGSGFISPDQLNKIFPSWLSWGIIIFGCFVILSILLISFLVDLDEISKTKEKKDEIRK